MSSVWGNILKVSIFGESHGKGIGVVIDGLPSGISLDLEYIKNEMERRAPGRNKLSTSRREEDNFEILSGYFENKTTGTPLCAVIYNRDQESKDYSELRYKLRPGHADYTGYIRYSGFNDYRGGGHFSGRITAPIVFAGAIAKYILEKRNIIIGSHVKSIYNIEDKGFDLSISEGDLKALRDKEIPTITSIDEKMKECILRIKEDKDSVGGIVETAIINIPEGLGSPFFDSVESRLAHILFSIPSVKGVEFGAGFDITRMKGSEANDQFEIKNGRIRTETNNNGGILGGITNGMIVIFRTAIKPTASIGKEQNTVDVEKMEEVKLSIKGRHDPCIVPRAIPVIEGAAALTILDLILERNI